VPYLLTENISALAVQASLASGVPTNKEPSESEDIDGGENVHLRLTEENILGDELKETEEINEYDTRSEVSSKSSDSSSMSSMNNSSSSESEHEPGKLITGIIFTLLQINALMPNNVCFGITLPSSGSVPNAF
jgi:hypothetical protein